MNNKKNILIAGGSGLLGRALCKELTSQNHSVSILTRSPKDDLAIKNYYWNVDKHEVDLDAFKNVDVLINLSGENVSNKRWSKTQKEKILGSRIDSTKFLFSIVKENHVKLEKYLSSSATGYYGLQNSVSEFTEEDTPGNDFLATVCKDWEDSAFLFESLSIPVSIVRIGVILSNDGGAFKKILATKNFGFISGLGSGNQIFPWIHIDDITGIFSHLIQKSSLKGIYNGVSPNLITMNELIDSIKSVFNILFKLPNVPEIFLNLLLGEMASIITSGNNISSKKIIKTGYKFNFDTIVSALKELDKK